MREFEIPPESSEELFKRNITASCPSCGLRVVPLPLHDPVNYDGLSHFIARCPNTERRRCKPFFLIYQPLNNCIIDSYPLPLPAPGDMDDAIPESMRNDICEAKLCRCVRAYKGALVLWRRVVEAIACDKLGDAARGKDGRTKRLQDLIHEMFKRGLITKDLKEMAHEVRHFGNYGAHIQDDMLDSVTADDADDVEEVTHQLIQSLYLSTSATGRLRKRRQSSD